MKHAFPNPAVTEDTPWPQKWAPPVAMKYAKSMALNPLFNKQPLYADDRLILEVPSDTGFEGTLGMTSADPNYESALGFAMELVGGGIAQVDAVGLRRHCLYFEATGAKEDGTVHQIKTWVLEVTTAKSGKNYATTGESVEFGTHEVPVRVYGAELLDAAGEKYTDENGNERRVFIVSSKPGDENYATFGDAVPDIRTLQQV